VQKSCQHGAARCGMYAQRLNASSSHTALISTIQFPPSSPTYHQDNPPQSVAPSTAPAVYPCPRRPCSPHASGCSRGTRRPSLGRRRCYVSGLLKVSRGGEPRSYFIVGRSTRFCVFSRKPARQSISFSRMRRYYIAICIHEGSNAFLIVPAMHAAERRILNSYWSFETSVTYSVVFSSAIVVR
jgi:hypothetical protein